jgi:hypothetical protein
MAQHRVMAAQVHQLTKKSKDKKKMKRKENYQNHLPTHLANREANLQ